MSETEEQKRERRHQEDLERLRRFRPIDDTFMRGLFKDNLPLADASDMHYGLLADTTRYLKENPKGVREMCKVMEELRDESYAEGRMEQARMTAKNLKLCGLTLEQIADAVGFDVETVRKWLTPKAV